tara:strand:+ start:3937 stop:4839 length:903 start_codon:yes stop_codon:yes gene_type:complete
MHKYEDIFPDVPFEWPTFLNTRPSESNPLDSLIWVIPVKYDSTVSYYAGTKFGPKAIVDASAELEDFDIELQKDPSMVGISTLPYLEPDVSSPLGMIEIVKLVVNKTLTYGKIPFLIGGEHTLSIGSITAAASHFDDISVLYLDAHGDLRAKYLGAEYCHATVARRLLENVNIVHVGSRSVSQSEVDFIANTDQDKLSYFPAPPDGNYTIEQINDICSKLSGNVYISLDLDVLDPSVMPAVGTPEPGGLSWDGVNLILSEVSETSKIRGVDIVEFAPELGPKYAAFTAAKLVYRIMGFCG